MAMFLSAALFAQTKATTAPAAKSTVAKTAPKTAPTAAKKTTVGNLLDPSTLKATAPAEFKAKFTTTQGDFVVKVTRAWAPLGADRFYNLVRGGYFNGAAFYRVIDNFMAQFGFAANPAVSNAWERVPILDDAVKQSNKRGMITYAKPGHPNSRTTQLFINYKDNGYLDAQGFSPFGEVIEGMDTVDKFYHGYGDTDQGALASGGKAYWEKQYPKFDSIKTAVIVVDTPAPTPAKAPAAATKAPAKATDKK